MPIRFIILVLLVLDACTAWPFLLSPNRTLYISDSRGRRECKALADPPQDVIMQYFDWWSPADGTWWNRLAISASELRAAGITAVWIPPAYKGKRASTDVGYGVYDKYDLGEFDQKGGVRTKYGTRSQLEAAVAACHSSRLQVYVDIVVNHLLSSDYTEEVWARQVESTNRNNVLGPSQRLTVHSKFTFPGRGGNYSQFQYQASLFTGVDGEFIDHQNGRPIYVFDGHWWSQNVDWEHGNYDYLLGLDLDFGTPWIRNEIIRWGKWFTDATRADGYRLDAVKHIDAYYQRDWLREMRAHTGRKMFSVGEYWSGDLGSLVSFLDKVLWSMSLFDVPLHYNLWYASKYPSSYDMSRIFDGTLVQRAPNFAVTFVDNHDTQPGQSLESWVEAWFKPIAYALVLLRAEGYPCVFSADYYGSAGDPDKPWTAITPMRLVLDKLLELRQTWALGTQRDYFVDAKYIGWTRERGLAVVISTDTYPEGYIDMHVGTANSKREFVDALGNFNGQTVWIDGYGNARFPVKAQSVSVWIPNYSSLLC